MVAQEFVPTSFDWRIGILDGHALYACRYYMARGHWQIYNNSNRQTVAGKSDTLPVEDVPRHVVETALKAARLVGDGLYGVDLKDRGDEALVIEVNDNPSLDHDVEDLVLKDSLYDAVIGTLVRRIESRTAPR